MMAIAPRPSGRVADDFAADASDGFEDICSLSAVSLLFLLDDLGSRRLLAVCAGAGDLDHREFWRKAGSAGGGFQAVGDRRRRNLADGPAALADQERHQSGAVVVVSTGEIGVAALDPV